MRKGGRPGSLHRLAARAARLPRAPRGRHPARHPALRAALRAVLRLPSAQGRRLRLPSARGRRAGPAEAGVREAVRRDVRGEAVVREGDEGGELHAVLAVARGEVQLHG